MTSHIDENLAILDAITPSFITYTQTEIAQAIGCSTQYISAIEASAKAKLARKSQLKQLWGESVERETK